MSTQREPILAGDLAAYVTRCPTAEMCKDEGISRSDMALKLVTVLLRQGWSAEEIIEYCKRVRLPRLEEEGERWLRYLVSRAKTNIDAYTNRTHGNADARDAVQGSSLPTPPTCNKEIDHNPPRLYDSPVLRFFVLKARREAEERGDPAPNLTEWRDEIVSVSAELPGGPVSEKTAQRLSNALMESGYFVRERIDGRSQAVHLTENGRRLSFPKGEKWVRFIPLKKDAPLIAETTDVPAEVPRPVKQGLRSPNPQRVRERQRRRPERFRKHNRINEYYRLSFRGNRVRYVQFLAPDSEWFSGPVWSPFVVGYDVLGLPLYLTIPTFGDDCPAADTLVRGLLPDAWKPSDQWFAPAVELEAEGDHFRIAEYPDENGELHPAVGVIKQSESNFFAPLFAAGLNNRIIRVRGTGTKLGRRYEFADAGEALDLPVTFDFNRFEADLSDPRRAMGLQVLPTGWYHMPPKRKKLVQRLLNPAEDSANGLPLVA